jgi:hypothetical protein
MWAKFLRKSRRLGIVVTDLIKKRYFIPAWGAVIADKGESKIIGFGAEESFDTFLSMNEPPPVPQGTPARFNHQESGDSDEGPDFSIFIK